MYPRIQQPSIQLIKSTKSFVILKNNYGLKFSICLCHLTGHYVRDICIYGIEDLLWIIKTNSMFANKFESRTFPEALDCLEQWHRGKVLRQAIVPIEPAWLLAVPHLIPNSKTNSSGGQ